MGEGTKMLLSLGISVLVLGLCWLAAKYAIWWNRRREVWDDMRLAALPSRCVHGLRKSEWCSYCDEPGKPLIPAADNRYDLADVPHKLNLYAGIEAEHLGVPPHDGEPGTGIYAVDHSERFPIGQARLGHVHAEEALRELATELGMTLGALDFAYDHSSGMFEVRAALRGRSEDVADAPYQPKTKKWNKDEFKVALKRFLASWLMKGTQYELHEYSGLNQRSVYLRSQGQIEPNVAPDPLHPLDKEVL